MPRDEDNAQRTRIEEGRVERIKRILAMYEIDPETAIWEVHGKAVIYHVALERIATKANIVFGPPQVLRAERDEAVLVVTGHMGAKTEWATGEALVDRNYKIKGNQAPYVYAMAEKRAKDRVVLKLIELHGDLYSEEEADDLKQQFDAEKAAQALIVEIDALKTHDEIETLMKTRRVTDDLAKMSQQVQTHIRTYAKDAYRYLRSRQQVHGERQTTRQETRQETRQDQGAPRNEWPAQRQPETTQRQPETAQRQPQQRLPENASDRRDQGRNDGFGAHKPPDDILAELRDQLQYCHTMAEVNATTDDFKDAIGRLTPPDISAANDIRTARIRQIEAQERAGS